MNMDGFIKKMINEEGVNNKKSVENFFSELQGKFYQHLLDAEMEIHIGYEKGSHSEKKTDNRRNGYSSNKTIKTTSGEFEVMMPRDRNGSFGPKIIPKRKTIVEDLSEVVISLYAKGMSLSDIKLTIKDIYKIKISTDYLSKLTTIVSEEIKTWQNRELKKCYPFIYVDCMFCHVKKELKSEKVAVYVMLGIDITGQKEVLGIWINQTEGAYFWTSILEELKERGVEEILFLSMDGLVGLPEAVEHVFPKTISQRCIVHIVRNIYKITNKKESKEIITDFKKIYTSSNRTIAEENYEAFLEKYKDKPNLITKVKKDIEHIFQLFDYPAEIRKIIYTTNPIESVNSALRKVTKGKGSFINEEALKKVLYLRIKELEEKWKGGTIGWNTILNQLIILFEERVTKYIKV